MLERQVSLVTTKQHRTHRLDKIHVVSSLHHRSKIKALPPKYTEKERKKEMGLEELEDLVLHTILSKLGPKDSARAACVSNKLRSSASEDSLWSIFCFQDLDLKEPLDPLGNPTPSFKVS